MKVTVKKMNRFLMFKFPSAYLCGVRLIELEEEKANAHIISAPPDMLREMESLAVALEDTGHEPPQSFYDAIKKARGIT